MLLTMQYKKMCQLDLQQSPEEELFACLFAATITHCYYCMIIFKAVWGE